MKVEGGGGGGGGGGSSMVRTQDSWSKGRRFESWQEWRGNLFFSPWSTFCAESHFGIRSTSVLPQ